MSYRLFPRLRRARINLDAAASTPLSRRALRAMEPYFIDHFGNAGSVYAEGVVARDALKDARVRCARTLSVRPDEITFTSGGTEANNLAIRGVVETYLKRGRAPHTIHLLTTALEHSSVSACINALKDRGVVVDYIPVDESGIIDIEACSKLLKPETVLVSVHYVNGEVGVVQPLRDLARIVREFRERQKTHEPFIHTDASQAPLYLDCVLEHIGVDLMTIDAHKIYGPKGVGLLAHRHTVRIEPQILGGGQEGGLRSGTEPVALIVGLTVALEEASQKREVNRARTEELRNLLLLHLEKEIPNLTVNGSMSMRVANNLNISLSGVDTEYLIFRLDARGVSASTRSTCEGDAAASHVVFAMTGDKSRAQSTLRLTLPLDITRRDTVRAARCIAEEVKILTKGS